MVASATAMYLVLFISVSTVTQYALSGVVVWNYALWTGMISALSTIVGIYVVNAIMKKTGRQSVLVFILGVLIVVALIVLPLQSIQKVMES